MLRKRRAARRNHEYEEVRIKNQIELLEEEDNEKAKITEDYIRKIFKRDPTLPELTDAEKDKKIELLNEYLSDDFMTRLSGLLTKQFTEKEQLLKAMLAKYTEQKVDETDGIKEQFKLDEAKL